MEIREWRVWAAMRSRPTPAWGGPANIDDTVPAALVSTNYFSQDGAQEDLDRAVDAFLETAGPDATTSVLAAELRQLGGALGRPAENGGVLDRLDGEFASFAVAIAATPELAAQGRTDAVRYNDSLRPFGTGREYLPFAENPVDAARAYPAERWTQLKGIRGAVDPHGVFVANHQVPRLGENDVPTA